ncbi:hypothetical protein [Aliarcobacter butzleri]|uniref:hypothetical protein n=1 Tax=Aliarcobacter butzleri TaxID=28197 RepID=UPI002B241D2B|nr:hypothetical protein [Aliarcobacter butzleri]
MRLLFIYFYKDFGTFEKGSIIHLSKKYKFSIDKEKSTENEFYFNKEENPNFIDDFYSKNIDIGVLIGENGTGKSVLINSLMDLDNDYSFIIYEINDKKYYIENVNKKFSINTVKISKKNILNIVYYSSIIDVNIIQTTNIFDISDKYLLSLKQQFNLLRLETNDLNKYFNMNKELDYPIPARVKLHYLNTFFKIINKKISQYPKEQKSLFITTLNSNILNEKAKKTIKECIKKLLSNNIRDILIDNLKNSYDLINLIFSRENYKYYNFYKEEKDYTENRPKKKEERKKIDDIFNNEEFINKYKQKMKIITQNKFIKELFSEDSEEKFKLQNIPNKEQHNIYLKKKELLDEIKSSLESLLSDIPKNLKYESSKKILNYLECELKEVIYRNEILHKINNFRYSTPLSGFIRTLELLYMDFKNENVTCDTDGSEIIYRLITNGTLSIEKFTDYLENSNKENIKTAFKIMLEYFTTKTLINHSKCLNLIKLIFINSFNKINDNLKSENEKIKLQNILGYIYCSIGDINKFKGYNFVKKEFNDLHNYLHNYFKIEKAKYIEERSNLFLKLDNSFFNNYELFSTNDIFPYTYTINPPLSSGQKAILFIFARINDAIQKINQENPNENILILLDEADLKLHLEWQRQFLYDLIKFLNSYPNNKFFILYATHSPMILSDVTNDRVVFLKKKDEKYSEDKQDFTKSTFGANIYDIYSDSFFVNNFMGEFAQNKINEVIKIIDEYKEKKEKNPDEFMPNEKALDNLKIVKSIGEPLLRNKLEDEIKSLVKDDIMEIVNNLKNKKNEEIEKELEKYSQFTQTKVLMKLLEIRK